MIQRFRTPDGTNRDIDHGPRSALNRGTLRSKGYIACDTMPNAMPAKLAPKTGDTFDYSRLSSLSSGPSFVRSRR